MQGSPNRRAPVGSTDWAAAQVLRILQREAAEKAALARLRQSSRRVSPPAAATAEAPAFDDERAAELTSPLLASLAGPSPSPFRGAPTTRGQQAQPIVYRAAPPSPNDDGASYQPVFWGPLAATGARALAQLLARGSAMEAAQLATLAAAGALTYGMSQQELHRQIARYAGRDPDPIPPPPTSPSGQGTAYSPPLMSGYRPRPGRSGQAAGNAPSSRGFAPAKIDDRTPEHIPIAPPVPPFWPGPSIAPELGKTAVEHIPIAPPIPPYPVPLPIPEDVKPRIEYIPIPVLRPEDLINESRGNPWTENLNYDLARAVEWIAEKSGLRIKHAGGAYTKGGGKSIKELYLPNSKTNGKQGSNLIDLAYLDPATKRRLLIQTIDTSAGGRAPSKREHDANVRVLRNKADGDILVLVPKLPADAVLDPAAVDRLLRPLVHEISRPKPSTATDTWRLLPPPRRGPK